MANQTFTVEQGQNLMDVAIMGLGDATGLFALAMLNNLSITDDLAAGTVLELPAVVNTDIVNYISYKKAIVATANEVAAIAQLQGIGYWILGQDFIVG